MSKEIDWVVVNTVRKVRLANSKAIVTHNYFIGKTVTDSLVNLS